MNCARGCTFIADPDQQTVCQIQCVARYNSPYLEHLNRCIIDAGCFPLVEETVPSFLILSSSSGDLDGEYYVVRGLNRGLDCFSCTVWAYDHTGPVYGTYLPDPIEYFEKSSTYDSERIGQGVYKARYSQTGVSGVDTQYVLAKNGDFALVWYSGFSVTCGNFQGAMVLSRKPRAKLSMAVEKVFSGVLKESGLGVLLDGFCVNENSRC